MMTMQLLYHLHTNQYYRNLFYHRLGPIKSAFIRRHSFGDRYFSISAITKIAKLMWIAHPYATISTDAIKYNFVEILYYIPLSNTYKEY